MNTAFPYQKNQRFSVSELNGLLQSILEGIPDFQDFWLIGEITSLKFYERGQQLYLTLTESGSSISCVIYETFLRNIPAGLAQGLSVEARGKLKVFKNKGTYSFQIHYISIQKTGRYHESLLALQRKLEKEGIFNPEKKIKIPSFPEKISIITSYKSAAMADFISLVSKKLPFLNITIIPAIVQGFQSQDSLQNAILLLNESGADLAYVLRGGGSNEDLSTFNEESVIRAIAAAPIPIITAIGHQTDLSLSDLAADAHYATPTAAAQALVNQYQQGFNSIIQTLLESEDAIQGRFESMNLEIIQLLSESTLTVTQKTERISHQIERIFDKIEHANPLKKLREGFSITKDLKTQKTITKISDVSVGQDIETILEDGKFISKVTQA